MAGYAALGRLDRVEVRPASWGSSTASDDRLIGECTAEIAELGADSPGGSRRERWSDRLASWRQTWAQTTFYLFDSHSWL